MTTIHVRNTEPVVEGRVLHLAERAIRFEQFLDMVGDKEDLELVNGGLVEKMSAQWPHERMYAFMFWLLYGYVRAKGLGQVAGSRSAVRIHEFQGRMPDILFIRSDREHIIRNRAIYGAPDLVVEIVSPNDRRGDLVALEADYQSIGVREIVFWDAPRRRVTVLRNRDGEYAAETLTSGEFVSEAVEGFRLRVEWLLADELPNEMEILNGLLTSDS